jgi:hypothetical protein
VPIIVLLADGWLTLTGAVGSLAPAFAPVLESVNSNG